jgi:hypothetical protein
VQHGLDLGQSRPHRLRRRTWPRPRNVFEDRHLNTTDFIRDAFKDDIVLQGSLLADSCAELYVGPEEDVPKEEQVNF